MRIQSTSEEHNQLYDNTHGQANLNLNLLIDDNSIFDGQTAQFRCHGTIHVGYVIFGDD